MMIYDVTDLVFFTIRIYYLMPGAGLRRTSTSSPSWIFKFLVPDLVSIPGLLVSIPDVCSSRLCDQARRPWTKAWTPVRTIRTEKMDSKIQDGEDVDVLRSLGPVVGSRKKVPLDYPATRFKEIVNIIGPSHQLY